MSSQFCDWMYLLWNIVIVSLIVFWISIFFFYLICFVCMLFWIFYNNCFFKFFLKFNIMYFVPKLYFFYISKISFVINFIMHAWIESFFFYAASSGSKWIFIFLFCVHCLILCFVIILCYYYFAYCLNINAQPFLVVNI